jgi:hypothetical protein
VARLDSPWVTAVFGLAVAIVTWDYVQITPAPGIDASWILGLNLATAQGLDYGTQIVFTYGPLGFLDQPMVVDGLLATLGGLWLLGLRAALAASLLWAARRSFTWPAAAALALAVAAIVPTTVGSVALALTALWCVIALQEDAPAWSRPLIVYGGGALAGVEAMIKLNVGATVLALVVICAIALPGSRVRNLAGLAATFAACFAALWIASGQGLGNLDDYVRTSIEIISGYQRSMQLENGVVGWDWAAAIAVIVATAAALLRVGAPAGRAARIATPVLLAVLSFSLLKYGFVRHDAGHVAVVFGVLAVTWLAPRWRGGERIALVAGLAAIAVVYLPISDQRLDTTFEPRTAVRQLGDLAIPSERDEAVESSRAALAGSYAVDPRILARADGQPVDALPWEIALIWAYGLDWRPLPVIQDYSAYTPELDRRNAEALASETGPRFVIRHLGYDNSSLVGIDGRLTVFDAPLEQRALLCRFRPVVTTDRYQLLERAADRCGAERPLGTATAEYGERVTIPAPEAGEAVFARIEGAGGEGVERLRTLAYKEALRTVALDALRTRFQTATAPDGILLSVPRGADFPAPFALGLGPRTIAIDSEGGFATSSGPLHYEFFALPVAPAGTRRG